jgi:hypothetical protein
MVTGKSLLVLYLTVRFALTYLQDQQAVDIAVVDQIRGPLVRCDWIEFGHISLDGDAEKRVAACRLRGSTSSQLFTPEGWVFQSSLSASYGFSPNEAAEKGLRFIRSEGGLDVYWSELLGKEVYIGRAGSDR